jgi:hypothetical protein
LRAISERCSGVSFVKRADPAIAAISLRRFGLSFLFRNATSATAAAFFFGALGITQDSTSFRSLAQ